MRFSTIIGLSMAVLATAQSSYRSTYTSTITSYLTIVSTRSSTSVVATVTATGSPASDETASGSLTTEAVSYDVTTEAVPTTYTTGAKSTIVSYIYVTSSTPRPAGYTAPSVSYSPWSTSVASTANGTSTVSSATVAPYTSGANTQRASLRDIAIAASVPMLGMLLTAAL